jgi:UDP-2,3-diacylglucosamine pyrophosphatase LpxH
VRSLVISDLPLGARRGNDVLTRPKPLGLLLDAVQHSDRLVLLGDTVELMEGRPRRALEIAAPVMRALGGALGADREVVIVPGNHDGPLARRWARAQGAALKPDTEVPPGASEWQARLSELLAPARVSVHYPGVWLSDRVWATHGHYLDRHLLPAGPVGLPFGPHRRLRKPAQPSEYEQARRPSLARSARWLPRPLAALLDDAAELLRAATMPAPRRLLNRRWAPLTATVLGTQTRRASIPALARVVQRLGIDADWVVFGHVHRLGPLPGEDLSAWQGSGGRPRIVNSGSWVYEPALVHRARPPHPYWPGGAVLLEDGGDPRPVGLLDSLREEDLVDDQMAVAELVPQVTGG